MEIILCHIDGEICDPDLMWVNYSHDEKQKTHCINCQKRQDIYDKMIEESIRRAEVNPESNIHLIRKEFEKKHGQFVKPYGSDINDKEQCGILAAVVTTLEDYYYVIINGNCKVNFESCCIKLDVIDYLTEVPDCYSELSRLQNETPDELVKIVEEVLNNSKVDKLITEINIKR